MKTKTDGSIEYEDADAMTLHCVTAPREMWQAIGLQLYSNTNDSYSDHSYFSPGSVGLLGQIMTAQDSLPADADGPAILRRIVTQRRHSREVADLCYALRSVKIEVPSNINVWQHVKGEGRLSAAAETVAAAAKQLVEMAAR